MNCVNFSVSISETDDPKCVSAGDWKGPVFDKVASLRVCTQCKFSDNKKWTIKAADKMCLINDYFKQLQNNRLQ